MLFAEKAWGIRFSIQIRFPRKIYKKICEFFGKSETKAKKIGLIG